MLADSIPTQLLLRQHVAAALRLADRMKLHGTAAKLAAAQAELDGDVGPWSVDDVERAMLQEQPCATSACFSDSASA